MRMAMGGMAAAGMVAVALTTAGCAENQVRTGDPLAGGASANAVLHDAAGAEIGMAKVTEVAGGLRVTVDTHNVPPGTHGIHIHTTGQCDAPGFAAAGGHWNPTGAHHGSMNPQGPHEGDLPNLIVGSDGRGTIGVTIPNATMAGLLDADGAAVVIHAGPDDLMSDPAGNSGPKIACGVLMSN